MDDSLSAFKDNDYCFACGEKNPLGLGMRFMWEGNCLTTTVCPPTHYQGFKATLHGGITATILDDLMSNHIYRALRIPAVTVELTIRLRKPVPVGEALKGVSKISERRGKFITVTSTLTRVSDPATALAEGTARFYSAEG
jgi:acyl-coenzyme A thioesterase PaaI-like protein